MKKVLVTGESGYIGMKFKEWIENNKGKEIILEFVSVRDDSWKNKDFSHYDSVLHLAGIAHVSRDPKLQDIYYSVNRDLTIELAKKSKKDKVNQFIFMSSIIVYGNQKIINHETSPNPTDFYGESKLQAEKLLTEISTEDFNIAIIRPPMVYGENCKGNFNKLMMLSTKARIFPEINNKRSMIYIENLCNFLFEIIINNDEGFFFPQNKKYVSTISIIKEINYINKRKIFLTNKFNFLVRALSQNNKTLKKVFGDLVYEESMSRYKKDYQKINFEDSIKKTLEK